MRTRVVAFGALGTLATLVAAGLLFAPDAVLSLPPFDAVAAALEDGDGGGALLLASVLVGLYLSWAARRATRTESPYRDPDAFDEATAETPEEPTAREGRRTAADLDAQIEDAAAGDGDAMDDVRERLRAAAVRAHARAVGCDHDAARAAVRDGDWTDDRTAAAFLADGSPTYTVWSRLRLWLDPERERRRRLERAVAATEGLAAAVRANPWEDGTGDEAGVAADAESAPEPAGGEPA